MKKLFKLSFIPLLVSVFMLVGCVEITRGPNTKAPEIELSVEGELEQIFELTETLEDVKFTLVLKNFKENSINDDDIEIKWFEGSREIIKTSDYKKHTVEVNRIMTLDVRVEVSFTLNKELKTLTDSRVIKISEIPTQVSLNNKVDNNNHILKFSYGGTNNVQYEARVSGNLTHSNAKWHITKRRNNADIVSHEEIEVDLKEEMRKEHGFGYVSLDYDFPSTGYYEVYLEVGKYNSNYQYVVVDYGSFEIITTNQQLVQTENYTNRVLRIEEVNAALGEGEYRWYLNNEPIEDSNSLTYVHDDNEIGGYLYHVEFIPEDEEVEVQKTEPVLVINAIEIDSVAKFKEELTNKTKAFALTDDLNFGGDMTNENHPLININYPLTIYGNGHTMTNNGIKYFIRVTANNVYFKNVTVKSAKNYVIHYVNSDNGYLEDVTLEEPGSGGALLDLSAGLYVENSEATIKNIKVFDGTSVGVRVEAKLSGNEVKRTILTVLGTFEHNGMLLPIASGKSRAEDVDVNAIGFAIFTIPIPNAPIRRWSNEKDAVSWVLHDPNRIDYKTTEAIDVFGITIDVNLSEGEEPDLRGDLDLVYLFLSTFNQYGTIEIMSMDGKIVYNKYYIIDHNEDGKYDDLNYEFGEDLLLYTSDVEGLNYVRPVTPNSPGQYLVRITIGDELDLGTFTIIVE